MGKFGRGPLTALLAAISVSTVLASAIPERLPLPAPVAINHDAGRGDWREWGRLEPKAPIFLKLHLTNSAEILFAIDTGAPDTIFDKTLIAKLGPRLETVKLNYGWKANGAPTVGIYAAPKLFLGAIPLKTGPRVYTDDLTRIWPGPPMAGILGMDCLKNYCLQFDFEGGQLRFLDPDKPIAADAGAALPLKFSGEGATTRLDFYGRKNVPFILDTAAYNDGSLTAKLFRYVLGRQESYWTVDWKLPGGSLGREEYVWDGAINHANYYQLAFADCSVGALVSRNFIGLHFLARHLVTFDFPRHKLYLKQQNFGPLGSSDGPTYKAREFLRALKEQGRLPGCAPDEHGLLTARHPASDTTNAPISRTFALQKRGYSFTDHYTVTQLTPADPWQLQKAWLTDTEGHTVKEYPVP